MQVVILAGGMATRLRPLTKKIPKSLIPIHGRPFIDYQLELLAKNNLHDIVLCVGYLGPQVAAHCRDGQQYGLKIEYSYDGAVPLGTGGALRHARPLLDEHFFVLYGDSYLVCPYPAIAAHFLKGQKLGLMTVYDNHNQFDRSNVALSNRHVVAYDKKNPSPAMTFIDYGLSAFHKTALGLLPVGPVDLARLHQTLIQQAQLLAYEVPQRFYEIGSRAGLQEFTRLMQAQITT